MQSQQGGTFYEDDDKMAAVRYEDDAKMTAEQVAVQLASAARRFKVTF